MDGEALIQEYINRRKLELWRKLRKERDFVNDDSVAKYLLSLHCVSLSNPSVPWDSSSIVNERGEHNFPYFGRLQLQ